MRAFIFQDELYIRTVPGKNLFKSSMVHEVVNRGDIFAIRVRDSLLTIIPGKAEVEHRSLELVLLPVPVPVPQVQGELPL